jgi:tetratricopeptide (TPR) repeat protein
MATSLARLGWRWVGTLTLLASVPVAAVPHVAHAAEDVDVTPEATHGSSSARDAAAGAADALQLSEQGSSLYRAGEYRRALEKFIEAYAIGKDPNLLFNMGRCYQQIGEAAVAREKYEAFIAAPGADPDGVERARAFLRELARPPAESAAEPATPAPVAAAPAESTPSPPVWPWVTLGAGVALAGTGAVLYALGASDHSELTEAPGYGDRNAVVPFSERRARDLVAAGDTKKLWGGVTLGVGGALLATSLVWLLVDAGSHEQGGTRARGWQLAVVPGRGAGSLAFSGAF